MTARIKGNSADDATSLSQYQHFLPSSIGGSLGVTVLVAAGESFVAFPVPPDAFCWVTTQPLSQSSWSAPFALASPDQFQVAIASGTLPASAGWSGFHINHVLKLSMAWTRSAIPATGWPGLSSDLNS